MGSKLLDKRGDNSIRSASDASKDIGRLLRVQKVGLIIIAVLIVLSLIGLLYQQFYNEKNKAPLTDFEKLELAVQSRNVSMCESLNPVKKEICINTILGKTREELVQKNDEEYLLDLAVESKNPVYCENISSPPLKDACLIETGVRSPQKSKPFTVDSDNTTQPTDYQKNEELIHQATESKDPTLCEQITNPVKRDLCYMQSNG